MILEYKLEATRTGMVTPPFIEDGGYFYNSSDHTYVGYTNDNCEFYVPSTVTTLTVDELKTRAKSLGLTTQGDDEKTTLTDSEIETFVDNWVSERG